MHVCALMTPSGPKAWPTESPGCQGRENRDRLQTECLRTQPCLKQAPVPTSTPEQSGLGKGPEKTPSLTSELRPREQSEERARVPEGSQTKQGYAGLESRAQAHRRPASREQVQAKLHRTLQKAHGGGQGAPRNKERRDQCLRVRVPAEALPTQGGGPSSSPGPRDSLFLTHSPRSQAEVVCSQAPVDVCGPEHMRTA